MSKRPKLQHLCLYLYEPRTWVQCLSAWPRTQAACVSSMDL